MESDQPDTGENLRPSQERDRGSDTVVSRTEDDSAKSPGSDQPLYLELLEHHIIRLLELEPGAPNDPVVLRLFVVELEHAPEFDAISYVWGSEKNRMPVTCNGRHLDVTVNLHAAFVRLRYTDRARTVWADAICINQGHNREKSHHVGFMNIIYREAKQVLVCMGEAPDGGAKDVAALVHEHTIRMSGYNSVLQMDILVAEDPLFEDPRWKSLAVLIKRPWFTRAWVLQEVGLAKDPQVFYGDAVFSYRDLMKLARWIMRCASNLEARAGISFATIHIDWENWSPDWRVHSTYPSYTLLDFLGHARGLLCKDPRDHIYAFLGHPLAQEDGGGPIIKPNYDIKDPRPVYLDLATVLLQKFGLRVLSSVEHDDATLSEDFPSWVFRLDVELVKNSFGIWPEYYYRASGDEKLESPTIIGGRHLRLQGITVDVVSKVYQFSTTSEDLESPAALRSLQASYHQPVSLDRIWEDLQHSETPCIYPQDERLKAFSLTLTAGLTNYECAEDGLGQHEANFAAYWGLRLKSTSGRSLPADLQGGTGQGDEERFWIDMSLSSEGRSFLITRKGRYGLGPWIAKPGDICCILLGANVPFILRNTDKASHYKLVGEAYIHDLMRGEALETREKDGLSEGFIIC